MKKVIKTGKAVKVGNNHIHKISAAKTKAIMKKCK